MSSFTSPLVVTPLEDGRNWKLVLPFRYHVGTRYSKDVIAVPVGFRTDFASIPKFLLVILPLWAKFNKAPILHDFLYRTNGKWKHSVVNWVNNYPYNCDRKQADKIFLEAMLIAWRDKKIGKFVAYLEYYGVRLFGWMAWRPMK